MVGGWDRTSEPVKPYTTAETMDAGWCWQIEHDERINRGYVYSSAFISDELAEREFRDRNPKLGPTRIVKFVSGVNETDVSGAQEFLDYYAENGPSSIWRDHLIGGRDVFGFEGYLAMMVGQRAPYRRLHAPTWAAWGEIRRANRELALRGLGVRESVEIIRSPQWSCRPRWPAGAFRR